MNSCTLGKKAELDDLMSTVKTSSLVIRAKLKGMKKYATNQ